jgi:hypothetical protein
MRIAVLMDVSDTEAMQAAMETQEIRDAMAYDGVPTFVIHVERQ